MSTVFLRRDECPRTIAILEALAADRDPAMLQRLHYERTESGVFVDWDLLLETSTSQGDKAAVQIARGCALAEAQGSGLPRRAQRAIVEGVAGLQSREESP